MKKPRLLILTNESKPGDAAGQIDGYELLVESGELGSVLAVSHKELFDSIPAFDRVMRTLTSHNYDVVLIWTPGLFPTATNEFDQMSEAIGSRMVLYWEGDAWGVVGTKKSVTPQMSWWMSRSDIVFSTVSQPHTNIFRSLGAKEIHHIINTYCHLKFASTEEVLPKLPTKYEAVMIANNTSQIPFFSGLPGSTRRWELTARLKTQCGERGRLYGSGWPARWSSGPLPYDKQCDAIREARLSLNWDNFHKYYDYSSDRLAIALIAGRPHVTTRHPGMVWAPGEDLGLFQETSPKMVMDRAKDLLVMDPDVTWKLGLEAHAWAKNRVSHRETARYIMSTVFDHVKKPPEDPWGKLPGPWIYL